MQGGIPGLLWIILMCMLPIAELRGGIPLAYFGYDYNIFVAYALCVMANMIPVPFILIFFDKVELALRRFKIFERFFNWLFERTRRRVKEKVDKYGVAGLMIFVAIPLPVTGAWTGALAAYLFGMDFRKSLGTIMAGVLIAGIIVSVVCVWAKELLIIFGGNI
jgi:uncharacterized membrane protein